MGGDGSNGRILYCHNSSWYSLCADNWNTIESEAKVICNTLGHDAISPPFMNLELYQYGKL